MKRGVIFTMIYCCLSMVFSLSGRGFADGEKVLFCTAQTGGFSHGSVRWAVAMTKSLGQTNAFTVDDDANSAVFTDANLAKYSAVVFFTSGDFLNDAQKASFQKFFHDGKGCVLLHSADNSMNGWPWWHAMLGSTFISDPAVDHPILHIVDKNHASTKDLPNPWICGPQQLRRSNWFFSDTSKDFRVLITMDSTQVPDMKFRPFVYTHNFEGGLMWYGSMGNTDETFTTDTNMRKCILGGILYALKRPGADGTHTPTLVPSSFTLKPTIGVSAMISGSLRIYDAAGRMVGTLDNQGAVPITLVNLKSIVSQTVSSGRYFLMGTSTNGVEAIRPFLLTR